MKSKRYAYIGGATVAALAFAIVGGKSLADGNKGQNPVFAVDASWPLPLPAPVGDDGKAHTWVQGEVAGNCIDQHDNVYTFNRGWEVGVTINGVLQGNQSGAINGNDATAGGGDPVAASRRVRYRRQCGSRMGQPQPDPNGASVWVRSLPAA